MLVLLLFCLYLCFLSCAHEYTHHHVTFPTLPGTLHEKAQPPYPSAPSPPPAPTPHPRQPPPCHLTPTPASCTPTRPTSAPSHPPTLILPTLARPSTAPGLRPTEDRPKDLRRFPEMGSTRPAFMHTLNPSPCGETRPTARRKGGTGAATGRFRLRGGWGSQMYPRDSCARTPTVIIIIIRTTPPPMGGSTPPSNRTCPPPRPSAQGGGWR